MHASSCPLIPLWSVLCAVTDGVALVVARRRKELRHPELVGSRLVVLGVEVGGRSQCL